MRTAYFLTLTALASLTGCESSSSSSTATSRPIDDQADPNPVNAVGEPGEGVWQGTMTSDVSGNTIDVVGLVNSWGELRLITEEGQYVGFVSISSPEISSALTGIAKIGLTWPDNSRIGDFVFDGTISERSSISGEYAGAGDAGTVSLFFDADSERSTTTGIVSGTWVLRDSLQNIIATLVIDADGNPTLAAVDGSDVDGCRYLGTVDAWTSELNVYDIVLHISNCPALQGFDINGEYSGSGAVLGGDIGTLTDNVLFIGISNDAFQFKFELERL